MKSEIYDIIIIGAGPAGLTAGLYASRRTLKTLILAKDLGGQMAISSDIENYPGIEKTDGPTLSRNFEKHAKKSGTEIIYQPVTAITKKQAVFEVSTEKNKYIAKALILAFGLVPRELNVSGEKKFKGRGVVYCATCDGPLFKNKTIAIVGGGNSAVEAAEYMAKIAKKIYLVNRSEKFKAEKMLLEEIKDKSNIEILTNSEIREIKGETAVSSVIMEDTKKNTKKEIKLNGVFVEIGWMARTNLIKDLVKLNKWGEVEADKNGKTSTPGVFACGDITDVNYKQVVIAAGEGAKAALEAYKYLRSD